jgi:glycosyltransferase involved in cell wall biosynthesis
MRFSVCIPTVRASTLFNAVRSVVLQTFVDWELIVVGQGDADSLGAEMMRAAAGDPRVRYVHLDRRGASAARNAGANSSTGEIVVFMDDDCEARRDWLATIDKCFRDDIGLVGGAVEAPAKDRVSFAVCPWLIPPDTIFIPPNSDGILPPGFCVLSANMAVRRKDFEQVGGFDECLGTGSGFGGGEERDILSRLARHQVHMRSTPESVVRHSNGYRYGLRSVYSHRRDRIRGDGAQAGKGMLLTSNGTIRDVRAKVWTEARGQLGTIRIQRFPMGILRVFHYLHSYRECLVDYTVRMAPSADPATGVLRRL